MSLNKFSNDDIGYNLRLEVGADTIKCNSLNVVALAQVNDIKCDSLETNEVKATYIQTNTLDALSDIELKGKPVANFSYITANYTATNGASVPNPTQNIGVYQSGRYLTMSDNCAVVMDASNTHFTFGLEFDLPPSVPLDGTARRIFVSGSGGGSTDTINVGYVVVKTNSTFPNTGRMSVIFSKSNNTNFSTADTLEINWEVKIDLENV